MSSEGDLRRLKERNQADIARAKANTPNAVIARYLTVGGDIVDITQTEQDVRAHCHGCPDAVSGSRWTAPFRSDLTGPDSAAQATQEAAAWAQRHASTCRAMPSPGSTQ